MVFLLPTVTFQSTHPMRGATPVSSSPPVSSSDFNPRTPCGVRHAMMTYATFIALFQSTHPMRGATNCFSFLNRILHISIHAPHAGCDSPTHTRLLDLGDFNPRTPCGVRPAAARRSSCTSAFQSTHPMRGATAITARIICHNSFQSTHPMRGATRRPRCLAISSRFQSTHPMRGATDANALACHIAWDFNPRTPCGVRPKLLR